VTERRMAEVMAEADRLDEVLVERQRPGDGARDLRDLERVGEPRAVVIAARRDEDLRLVAQAAKRLGVHDPVAVALQRRAQPAVRLLAGPDGRVRARGADGEVLVLPRPAGGGEALCDGPGRGVGLHQWLTTPASPHSAPGGRAQPAPRGPRRRRSRSPGPGTRTGRSAWARS